MGCKDSIIIYFYLSFSFLFINLFIFNNGVLGGVGVGEWGSLGQLKENETRLRRCCSGHDNVSDLHCYRFEFPATLKKTFQQNKTLNAEPKRRSKLSAPPCSAPSPLLCVDSQQKLPMRLWALWLLASRCQPSSSCCREGGADIMFCCDHHCLS